MMKYQLPADLDNCAEQQGVGTGSSLVSKGRQSSYPG